MNTGKYVDLHITQNNTLTSRKYVDKLLKPHVTLVAATENYLLLVHDNARFCLT